MKYLNICLKDLKNNKENKNNHKQSICEESLLCGFGDTVASWWAVKLIMKCHQQKGHSMPWSKNGHKSAKWMGKSIYFWKPFFLSLSLFPKQHLNFEWFMEVFCKVILYRTVCKLKPTECLAELSVWENSATNKIPSANVLNIRWTDI